MADGTAHPEHDYEALAVQIVETSADIASRWPGLSIATKLPRSWKAGDVALRIRRIGGTPTEDRVARISRARLQVEAFHAEEGGAFALCAAAVAYLREHGPGAHPGVVVTKVGTDLGIANLPDPDSDSERFVAGVVIFGHWAAA